MSSQPLLHIILRTIHSLQTDASLKPIVWGAGLTVEQKQEKMETFIQNSRIIFRRCRYNYLFQMIHLFKQEDDKITSRIEELMSVKTRICTNQVKIKFIFINTLYHLFCWVKWVTKFTVLRAEGCLL